MRADGVDTLCNILARSQKRARKTSLVCFTSMQHGKNFISRNKMEILCDYALTYLRMLLSGWIVCLNLLTVLLFVSFLRCDTIWRDLFVVWQPGHEHSGLRWGMYVLCCDLRLLQYIYFIRSSP